MADDADKASGEGETVSAHCPRCGPDWAADVCASHRVTTDGDGLDWIEDRYDVLRCGQIFALGKPKFMGWEPVHRK